MHSACRAKLCVPNLSPMIPRRQRFPLQCAAGGIAMRFSFTSEQEEFRSILRRFMESKSPTKEVRRMMDTETGWDRDAWKKTNQEIGLTAVAIPEAYGGQG